MTTLAAGVFPQSRLEASSSLSMPGFVGAYFGLRVCITFLLFQSDAPAGAVAGFALNLLLLLIVAFYAAGPASMKLRDALRVLPFRLVLAFLLLALVSLCWSETQSIAAAFGYWTEMAADVALVFLLLRSEPPDRATPSLMKGYVLGVCLLAFIAWASPGTSDLRLGNDEFLNPNAIGYECAFGALLGQHLALEGPLWKWLSVFLGITLLRSLSKTSIVAFVLVECVFLLGTNRISRSTRIAIGLGAMLVVALFWNLFSAYYAVYSNASTQAETLSGRVGIWLTTLDLALQEPWFGHGLHSFRAVVPAFGAFEPWHAHNELLHQFFVYGVIGIVLVVALYAILFFQARTPDAGPLGLLTRTLLLLVVIRGLTDTERFDLSFPLWAITALSLSLGQVRESEKEVAA